MKVMVCTDGSELSKKAIETAVGVALPLNAELIGMTAVKGAEPKDGLAGLAVFWLYMAKRLGSASRSWRKTKTLIML